jgi:hypothetical protein
MARDDRDCARDQRMSYGGGWSGQDAFRAAASNLRRAFDVAPDAGPFAELVDRLDRSDRHWR